MTTADEVRHRLALVVEAGRRLESEGLPFPWTSVSSGTEEALRRNEVENAFKLVRSAEVLYGRASKDWTWLRELLRRTDELRALAASVGVDLNVLDTRVGNPRSLLGAQPLSNGGLERAAASASLALAVLNDAIPKFCVQEAAHQGEAIRRARDRGEDIAAATAAMAEFVEATRQPDAAAVGEKFLRLRSSVAEIPTAPVIPISEDEEEEILLEARNLARRLHRIKGRARDVRGAARLMAQVRAALSEDRRTGTPEEEIEALWSEVDRLTRERGDEAEAGFAGVPGLNDLEEPEPDPDPASLLPPRDRAPAPTTRRTSTPTSH